jgi:arginyl-tRNA synthetase
MSETVLIEILSADPIGPLSLAQGRTAVQGDVLANLFTFLGQSVQREYYVNDMGQRAAALCDSVKQCLLSSAEGDAIEGRFDPTVRAVADRLLAQEGPSLAEASDEEWWRLCESAVPEVLLGFQRETLERLGVRFDTWFEEWSLSPEVVQSAVQRLVDLGQASRVKGATWLHADSADRTLLQRANGSFTYFAVDLAYHLSKVERGATRMVDIWGSAYQRHRARLTETVALLGVDAPLEILVSGGIRFENDGMPVNYLDAASVLLDPLLETASPASLRYLLNAAPPESDLVLEVDSLNVSDSHFALADAHEIVATLPDAEPPVSSLSDLEAALATLPAGLWAAPLVSKAATTAETLRAATKQRRPDLLNLHLNGMVEAYRTEGGRNAFTALEEASQIGVRTALQTTLNLLGISLL